MIAIVLLDGDREAEVRSGTEAHTATMEWAAFHGLDPMRIPAGSVIERDVVGRRILFSEFVRTGPRVSDILIRGEEPVTVERVEQGEAPPLPFPAVVWS